MYSKVGFPGACGSMDVTHFKWNNCPSNYRNFFIGRYSYPSILIQAIVDHNRRILYLSQIYNGKENDKVVTYNDEFCMSIINGRFSDIEYCLYDEDGNLRLTKGGYLIVDGGYQKFACLVDPIPDCYEYNDIRWSEYLTFWNVLLEY